MTDLLINGELFSVTYTAISMILFEKIDTLVNLRAAQSIHNLLFCNFTDRYNQLSITRTISIDNLTYVYICIYLYLSYIDVRVIVKNQLNRNQLHNRSKLGEFVRVFVYLDSSLHNMDHNRMSKNTASNYLLTIKRTMASGYVPSKDTKCCYNCLLTQYP